MPRRASSLPDASVDDAAAGSAPRDASAAETVESSTVAGEVAGVDEAAGDAAADPDLGRRRNAIFRDSFQPMLATGWAARKGEAGGARRGPGEGGGRTALEKKKKRKRRDKERGVVVSPFFSLFSPHSSLPPNQKKKRPPSIERQPSMIAPTRLLFFPCLLLATAAAAPALRPAPRTALIAAVATLAAPPAAPPLIATCVTSAGVRVPPLRLGGGGVTAVAVAPLFPGQALACRLVAPLARRAGAPPSPSPHHTPDLAEAPRPDVRTRCVVVAPGGGGDAGRRGALVARCPFNVTLAVVAPAGGRTHSTEPVHTDANHSIDVASGAHHHHTLASGAAARAAAARAAAADDAVAPGDSVPLPGQYMLAAFAAATAGVAVGAVGGLAGAHAADAVAYHRAGGRLMSRAGAEWMASGRRWR